MKYILSIILCLTTLYTYAQQTYVGKITTNNNTPITNVVIQSKNNLNNAVITNLDGNFSIIITQNPVVTIKHIGYSTKTITLNKKKNIIILKENDSFLGEVIISASRELQRRKEIPASISVITKKELNEVKAFGIDQLINDVPGVLVSTSRAASNEQHFMSVRSPISTKSLFLYLEDGLPIRPTAVFNHNALLEMNNVSFERVEILKGPASSIYGSEAIGGSFNFITKNPTKDFSGNLDFQINNLGLNRYAAEVSQYANNNIGFYLGAQYVNRINGPVSHSNYEKFALTFKNVNHFSASLNWVNSFNIVDYRSDMTGSLSEDDYNSGNYESDQTFTERDVFAFRFKSTLDKSWNKTNKTIFNFFFRKNDIDQNPSFRISQLRDKGQLTGLGSGELNSNSLYSYSGLIQHKIDFSFANSSLILGATADVSPQKYIAETLDIIVDTQTGQNTDFIINSGDFILNYKANILNHAYYFQYEINPIKQLKLTTALRYDKFEYDYNNLVDDVVGAKDSNTNYDNISPKLGVNYNLNKNLGFYANYSNGFSPPQTSTLYRNRFVDTGENVFELKPSIYNNFELGTYTKINKNITLDIALYMINGKNTLITLRDTNDDFFNTNAGKTKSYGIEYGVTYQPTKKLKLSHSGSYAKHKYISFFDRGVDYSNTNRETAPSLLGTSKINYNAFKNFNITLSHELVGKYNTSFENQVNTNNSKSTATYKGHNIFNTTISYKYKSFNLWLHTLNVFNQLYSARASYNRFRGENSYTIGNPRAFHMGVKYNF